MAALLSESELQGACKTGTSMYLESAANIINHWPSHFTGIWTSLSNRFLSVCN